MLRSTVRSRVTIPRCSQRRGGALCSGLIGKWARACGSAAGAATGVGGSGCQRQCGHGLFLRGRGCADCRAHQPNAPSQRRRHSRAPRQRTMRARADFTRILGSNRSRGIGAIGMRARRRVPIDRAAPDYRRGDIGCATAARWRRLRPRHNEFGSSAQAFPSFDQRRAQSAPRTHADIRPAGPSEYREQIDCGPARAAAADAARVRAAALLAPARRRIPAVLCRSASSIR